MTIRAGVGFSDNPDPQMAADEAASLAKKQLKENRIDLALVFSSPDYNSKELLKALHGKVERTRLIGATTQAILFPEQVRKNGVAVTALYSDNTRFETGFTSHLDLQELPLAGKTLAKECQTDLSMHQRKLFLTFLDGMTANPSDLLAGVRTVFGKSMPIWGARGSTSLGQKTFVHHHENSLNKAAVAALIGGNLECGYSCQHGFKPLGAPRKITRSDKNVIQEISHEPAFQLYKEFLQEEADTLPQSEFGYINARYPLGMRMGPSNEYLLRNVSTSLDDGSLICQDSFGRDNDVHLMISNPDFCLQSAETAARAVKEQLKNRKPHLLLIFESATRYRFLGRNTINEIRLITDILDPEVTVGMISHGEIVSHKQSEEEYTTCFQNSSVSVLAIR